MDGKFSRGQFTGLSARKLPNASVSAFERPGVAAPYIRRMGSLTRWATARKLSCIGIGSCAPATKRNEAWRAPGAFATASLSRSLSRSSQLGSA